MDHQSRNRDILNTLTDILITTLTRKRPSIILLEGYEIIRIVECPFKKSALIYAVHAEKNLPLHHTLY
jgi:hypothetical protein